MMKRTFYAISFLALLISCKKSGDQPCYGLVSPVNSPQNISPVFTRLNWLNCSSMPAQIALSPNSDFSNPVLKIDTFSTALQADTILAPLTKYYWIVTVHGQTRSDIDSFTTSDYPSIISGRYSGSGRFNNYGLIGDTTYDFTLNVNDAGNNKISLQLPGIDTVVFSKVATTDTSIVYSCHPCIGKYNGFKSLTYFPLKVSIDIVFQTGAANYDEWDFNGAKPVY